MNPWVNFYEEVMGFRNILCFDDKDISTEYSALIPRGDGSSVLMRVARVARRETVILSGAKDLLRDRFVGCNDASVPSLGLSAGTYARLRR